MNRPLRPISCVVCGATGARLNYQAMTCGNCRVFFYRFISNPKEYPKCSNDCPFDTDSLSQCKLCRFKKCVEVGMRASDVGRRIRIRAPGINKFKNDEPTKKMLEYHGTLINYGFKAAERLKLSEGAREFTKILAHIELLSIGGTGTKITEISTDLNLSVAELIQNPGACTSRDSAVFYPVLYDANVLAIDYRRSYCRVLTAFADFLGAIEEFLVLDDKDKLLKSRLLIYMFFEAMYRYYILKKQNSVPYTKVPYIGKNAPRDHWNKRQNHFCEQTVLTLTSFFQMDLSFEEYLLLRIIAMFNNGSNLTPEGYKVTVRVREKYILMLSELMRSRFSHEQSLTRITTILTVIRVAEEYVNFGKEQHARMVLNDVDDMKGKLTWEMHITDSIYEKII